MSGGPKIIFLSPMVLGSGTEIMYGVVCSKSSAFAKLGSALEGARVINSENDPDCLKPMFIRNVISISTPYLEAFILFHALSVVKPSLGRG